MSSTNLKFITMLGRSRAPFDLNHMLCFTIAAIQMRVSVYVNSSLGPTKMECTCLVRAGRNFILSAFQVLCPALYCLHARESDNRKDQRSRLPAWLTGIASSSLCLPCTSINEFSHVAMLRFDLPFHSILTLVDQMSAFYVRPLS